MMRRMLPSALTLGLALFGASAWGHDNGYPSGGSKAQARMTHKPEARDLNMGLR